RRGRRPGEEGPGARPRLQNSLRCRQQSGASPGFGIRQDPGFAVFLFGKNGTRKERLSGALRHRQRDAGISIRGNCFEQAKDRERSGRDRLDAACHQTRAGFSRRQSGKSCCRSHQEEYLWGSDDGTAGDPAVRQRLLDLHHQGRCRIPHRGDAHRNGSKEARRRPEVLYPAIFAQSVGTEPMKRKQWSSEVLEYWSIASIPSPITPILHFSITPTQDTELCRQPDTSPKETIWQISWN